LQNIVNLRQKIGFPESKMYRRQQDCYTVRMFPNLLYFLLKIQTCFSLFFMFC
jgi:hypothetical protein